jgi:hypothetical protein
MNTDKYYFTGKPCKYGHVAPRLKSNHNCQVCAYEKRQKYEHSEKYAEWKAKNKKKVASSWQKRNKGHVNSLTRARQAAKLQRTPAWLTTEQLKEIEEFYIMAQELEAVFPWKQCVDHIIPLQGRTVSGLHVPSNLQILSAKANMEKGNRYYG